jgi:selenocysteine-specific elongation factor
MESEAEIRLLSHQKQIASGASAFARIVLKNETLLLPGDRFILRSFSPVHTIAGGEVLDLHFQSKRLKRLGQTGRLAAWSKMTPAERSQSLAAESPLGCAESDILIRLAIEPSQIDPSLLRAGPWLITAKQLSALEAKLQQRLAQHHKDKPLEAGLSREAARAEFLPQAPPALLDLLLSRAPNIVAEADHLRLKTHQVKMAGAEDAAAKKIAAAFLQAGLLVPSVDDVLKSTTLPLPQAKAVLALLLRSGQLIRVSPELVYHRDALQSLKQLIQSKKGQRFGVPEFKDWTGASRKFAIPLLEYLDREKSTRRDGDQRIAI